MENNKQISPTRPTVQREISDFYSNPLKRFISFLIFMRVQVLDYIFFSLGYNIFNQYLYEIGNKFNSPLIMKENWRWNFVRISFCLRTTHVRERIFKLINWFDRRGATLAWQEYILIKCQPHVIKTSKARFEPGQHPASEFTTFPRSNKYTKTITQIPFFNPDTCVPVTTNSIWKFHLHNC